MISSIRKENEYKTENEIKYLPKKYKKNDDSKRFGRKVYIYIIAYEIIDYTG